MVTNTRPHEQAGLVACDVHCATRRDRHRASLSRTIGEGIDLSAIAQNEGIGNGQMDVAAFASGAGKGAAGNPGQVLGTPSVHQQVTGGDRDRSGIAFPGSGQNLPVVSGSGQNLPVVLECQRVGDIQIYITAVTAGARISAAGNQPSIYSQVICRNRH